MPPACRRGGKRGAFAQIWIPPSTELLRHRKRSRRTSRAGAAARATFAGSSFGVSEALSKAGSIFERTPLFCRLGDMRVAWTPPTIVGCAELLLTQPMVERTDFLARPLRTRSQRPLAPSCAACWPSGDLDADAGELSGACPPRRKRHTARDMSTVMITALDAHHSQIAWMENSSR